MKRFIARLIDKIYMKLNIKELPVDYEDMPRIVKWAFDVITE